MTPTRTPEQKATDTAAAFAILREEVTPAPMRSLITQMTSVSLSEEPLPRNAPPEVVAAQAERIAAYAALVQSSMALARIVAANDRAAMIAAAMITQSGVARPVVNTDDEA